MKLLTSRSRAEITEYNRQIEQFWQSVFLATIRTGHTGTIGCSATADDAVAEFKRRWPAPTWDDTDEGDE